MTAPQHPIRRALVSVSDKTGIARFAATLAVRNVALISTGGSARALTDAGLPVTEVTAVTGFPEMLDGRVKTLHPAIHAGVLARRDRPDDLAALAERGIAPIDLVVCNLYPFAETVASGASIRSTSRLTMYSESSVCRVRRFTIPGASPTAKSTAAATAACE